MLLNIDKVNFDALPISIREYAISVFEPLKQFQEVIQSNLADTILSGVVKGEIVTTAIFDIDFFPLRYDPIVNRSEIIEGYTDNYKIGFLSANDEIGMLEHSSALWVHKVFSGVYNRHITIESPAITILDADSRLFVESFMDHAHDFGHLMFHWSQIFEFPFLFEPFFAERANFVSTFTPVPNDMEPMEVIELVTGLIQAKKLTGTKKIHYQRFAELFGVEIKYLHKYINDLQKRKHGSETPLFDKCKSALLNHLQK